MSEYINNREYRKEVIKEILSQLHKGKSVEDVKEQFDAAFKGVSATEISEAEQALILEGVPVAEVQKLCDVHASVFKGSIEEIHAQSDEIEEPGHPVALFKAENRLIENIIDTKIQPVLDSDLLNIAALREGLGELMCIDTHYLRKENIFFPYMEKYGITAPPKVMWGVDDEIRAILKDAIAAPESAGAEQIRAKAAEAVDKIREMIFKEENILLPMLAEVLTRDEWVHIAQDGEEIGYIIDNVPTWNRARVEEKQVPAPAPAAETGEVTLPTGTFKLEELEGMLNTLPFDITFVDKNDVVKYFSEGSERIFPRTKAVIGRNVANCHPPASVHIVEKIVEDFKAGKKDHEDFWIPMGNLFVFIRYFAVRNPEGEYLGVLEVTQNIKPIQEIEGQKRLLSE